MDQGLIPSRYAKALYKTALERGADKRLYALFGTVADAFAANPRLATTIANPFVDDATKRGLLLTAAGVGADAADAPLYGDFLTLLARNKRMALMRDTALAYRRIYRQANNIHRVGVTTAAPLDAAAEQKLKQLIAAHLGKGATMEYASKVDPSLIGGFRVNVDNERLDASVAGELDRLRQSLISK